MISGESNEVIGDRLIGSYIGGTSNKNYGFMENSATFGYNNHVAKSYYSIYGGSDNDINYTNTNTYEEGATCGSIVCGSNNSTVGHMSDSIFIGRNNSYNGTGLLHSAVYGLSNSITGEPKESLIGGMQNRINDCDDSVICGFSN